MRLNIAYALGLVSVLSEAAVETFNLAPSAVDTYRVESHYGPPEAILNPGFVHDSKIELSGAASYAPLSSLYKFNSFGGSLTYHINRRHAIEPIYYSRVNGDVSGFVEDEVAAKVSDPAKKASLSVDIPRSIFAASYLFSPYHAKLHWSSRAVSDFDVYLGLGFAGVENEAYFLDSTKGDSKWRFGASLTAGLRFLFMSRLALRLEARDFIHRSRNFDKNSTSNTFHVGAGLSVFLF